MVYFGPGLLEIPRAPIQCWPGRVETKVRPATRSAHSIWRASLWYDAPAIRPIKGLYIIRGHIHSNWVFESWQHWKGWEGTRSYMKHTPSPFFDRIVPTITTITATIYKRNISNLISSRLSWLSLIWNSRSTVIVPLSPGDFTIFIFHSIFS